MFATPVERSNALGELAWVESSPIYRALVEEANPQAVRFRLELERLARVCRDGAPTRAEVQARIVRLLMLATGPFASFQRSIRLALFRVDLS